MSNPTTGEQHHYDEDGICESCGQYRDCIPADIRTVKQATTTGEWTGDDDGVLLPMHRFVGQYAKEIANAHNAALDAAYQKGKTDEYRRLIDKAVKSGQDCYAKATQSKGEWTEDSLRTNCEVLGFRETAKVINAALVAEREKKAVYLKCHECKKVTLRYSTTIDGLRCQSCGATYVNCKQVEQQLAAERKLLGQQIEATTAARLRATEAERQLAAELERYRKLLDAEKRRLLKWLRENNCHPSQISTIDAALAKIGSRQS